MAPILEPPPAANVIQAWPLFTAYDTDGHPLVGGKLYTYDANTSVPKATYGDPFCIAANTNPVVLSADGNALVYLDGFYRLILTDAEDVQRWEIDNYEYPSSADPPPSGVAEGYTDGTVSAVAGSGVLTVSSLVPLGYRCTGVIIQITTAFGASNGLTGFMIGDSTACDRWGVVTNLAAGTETGQRDFRAGDEPVAATAYTVLLSAVGGTFDTVGACNVRAFWRSLVGWS